MRVKSEVSSGVEEVWSFAFKSLTYLRREIAKALSIRYSQIFAPLEGPAIFMLSSIQRADAAAGILAAASFLLMCPCSCLIKKLLSGSAPPCV